MNNNEMLKKLKSELGKAKQDEYISQEEIYTMISERSGVPVGIIYKVFRVMRDITAERIKNNEDSLIPGIMRIGPGEGGLTRRYVKIKSVSRYLKEELK